MTAVTAIRPAPQPHISDYTMACAHYQHHTESAAYCLSRLREADRNDSIEFNYWLSRATEELEAADKRACALGVVS
jgi:hypothetical protein